MIREAPAMTVRQNLGELLNQVQYRNDSIVITRDGKPVAALVDIDLFNKIRRMREEFERTLEALRSAYEGVDPLIAQAEIDEAVHRARLERLAEKTKSRGA